MSSPRRRLVRPTPPPPPRQTQQLVRTRGRLGQERDALARWMKRLRRACNEVQKHQLAIQRLERRIAQMEGR